MFSGEIEGCGEVRSPKNEPDPSQTLTCATFSTEPLGTRYLPENAPLLALPHSRVVPPVPSPFAGTNWF